MMNKCQGNVRVQNSENNICLYSMSLKPFKTCSRKFLKRETVVLNHSFVLQFI